MKELNSREKLEWVNFFNEHTWAGDKHSYSIVLLGGELHLGHEIETSYELESRVSVFDDEEKPKPTTEYLKTHFSTTQITEELLRLFKEVATLERDKKTKSFEYYNVNSKKLINETLKKRDKDLIEMYKEYNPKANEKDAENYFKSVMKNRPTFLHNQFSEPKILKKFLKTETIIDAEEISNGVVRYTLVEVFKSGVVVVRTVVVETGRQTKTSWIGSTDYKTFSLKVIKGLLDFMKEKGKKGGEKNAKQ